MTLYSTDDISASTTDTSESTHNYLKLFLKNLTRWLPMIEKTITNHIKFNFVFNQLILNGNIQSKYHTCGTI